MDVQFKGKGGHSSLPPADGSQVGLSATESHRFLLKEVAYVGLLLWSAIHHHRNLRASQYRGQTLGHQASQREYATECALTGSRSYVLVQAVTRMASFLGVMYARLPAPIIVSPTLEFLQAVGLASSNPLISFVLARSASW